jgi:hypothetical protein
MEKIYIRDFIDDLNYHAVVIYVDSSAVLDELYSKLRADSVSHLYRFDSVRENKLFYIENCDLQDVTINANWNELFELIENGYSIVHLKKDNTGFYVVVPDILEMRESISKGGSDGSTT